MNDEPRLTPHVCESRYPFDEFLQDVRVPFFYRAPVRVWGIARVDDDSIPDGWWSWAAVRPVRFCPWCGRPFPRPLMDEWVEALAELGLRRDSPGIPEDLRTDRWWRALGHDRDDHVDPLPEWSE